MNLDPANPRFEGYIIADGWSYPFKKTPDYSATDWVFDSNALFSICSDIDGMKYVTCDIQNFKVLQNIPDYDYEVIFGNKGFFPLDLISHKEIVEMLADYKLNKATDPLLTNSITGASALNPMVIGNFSFWNFIIIFFSLKD